MPHQKKSDLQDVKFDELAFFRRFGLPKNAVGLLDSSFKCCLKAAFHKGLYIMDA